MINERLSKIIVLLAFCCFAVALAIGLTGKAFGAELSSDSESIVHVFDDFEDVADQDFSAGELSAGKGDDQNVIIGSDDRTKVGNSTKFPYSAVARVEFTRGGRSTYLTGFFISPDTVITNAHGVYDVASRNWSSRLEVHPGYNDGISHLGSAAAVSAVIHSKYINSPSSGVDYTEYNSQYDLAVLKLSKSFNVGSFPLSTAVSLSQSFKLIGYPYDKGEHYQYESTGSITQLNADTVYHNADMWGGNSGSPMLNSSNQVIAVNCAENAGGYNIGVRLTNDKINWINKAKNSYLRVYRVYNPNTSEHFFTINANEKNSLVNSGWNDEGVAWYTSSSGTAVYRLYNSNGSEHHYTTSVTERDALKNAGWRYEQVAWYAPTADAYPIYRLRNPNKVANNHHFTMSASEKDSLVKSGWIYEGVAWLGYSWIGALKE